MAATTTIVAWSIIDYKIGYENAGKFNFSHDFSDRK